MSNAKKLSRSWKRITKKLFGVKRFPALLGDADGNIEASDGFINAILRNGQVVKVANSKVSNRRMKAWIGYDEDNPTRMQVLGERYSYHKPLTAGIPLHWADNHAEFKQDMATITANQIIPLLAVPGSTAFSVQIYGAIVRWSDGTAVAVQTQEIDLAADVPTTGAIYCTIFAQADGTCDYVTSVATPCFAPELLTPAFIPVATTGLTICAVRLYAGQDGLHKDDEISDFVDLRFLSFGDGGTSSFDMPATIHAADAASLADADEIGFWQATTSLLKKITWANIKAALATTYQAVDATLTSISALGTAADKIIYTTAIDTWAEAPITAAGRALLGMRPCRGCQPTILGSENKP